MTKFLIVIGSLNAYLYPVHNHMGLQLQVSNFDFL